MYEVLVKRLRGLPAESFTFEIMDALHEAANAIEELSRLHEAQRQNLITLMNEDPEMEWIPVTERLPEVDKNVLVFACGNEITIGRMKRQTENGYHVFIICHGIARELARPGRITHWMPLPEPPKEDGE